MMDKKTLQQMSEQAHKMLRLLQVRAKGRGLEGLAESLEILNKDLGAAMVDAFGGTYDWGKDVQEFKEFEAPPKPGTHAYGFSGVETCLFAVRDGEPILIPSAQGISWQSEESGMNRPEVMGNVLCALLGPSPFEVGMVFDKFILQAQPSEDRFMSVVLDKVRIVGYGSGVSIEDILIDERYLFRADSVQPWKLGQLVAKDGDNYILALE